MAVEEVTPVCSDCPAPARPMTPAALRRGSTVREPGEGLCGGCSSRRVLMVRELDRMPNNLQEIRAKRMSRFSIGGSDAAYLPSATG